jgi:deoxyribodipyrimidine photolyase
MTVYLLDARFLADVVRDDKRNKKKTAIDIDKQLARLGQPVLVSPGQRKLLKELRDQLDRYRDIPHVFSFRKGRSDLPDVIASITRKLRRRGKAFQGNDSKPYVITGDVNLAIATAGEKHYTHLVAAEKAPANLPEFIRLHATPEELAEHLAKERPPHLSIPQMERPATTTRKEY